MISDWRREHEVVLPSQIEVRSGQVACSLAACGAGVAIVDDLTARAWPGGRLGFRPITGSPSFAVFAVRNDGASSSLLATSFVEKVAAGFRGLAAGGSGRIRKPTRSGRTGSGYRSDRL